MAKALQASCRSLDAVDGRDLVLINKWILSHEWELAFHEKSPIGIIARFKCKMCGIEIAHLISEPIKDTEPLSLGMDISSE